MAHFTIEFYSQALIRPVTFLLVLPNDPGTLIAQADNPYYKRPTKTVILLHGYTGAAANWGIDDLAERYNVAMVMPNGENAFYLDGPATGHKYATFVGEELIAYLRSTFSLAQTPEDTAILGLSMGGFGALHTGFAYPKNFSQIGAMSSALIVHEIASMKPGSDNGVANYEYYKACFGDLEKVLESDANPEVLAKRCKEEGTLPRIYMCCGTEDFLLENNREFHRFLVEQDIPHEYKESKGSHDDVFWGEYRRKIIEWMFA